MELITSAKNNRVKDWAALKQKKFRDQTGFFIIEGIRLVEDALESNAPIEVVLLAEDLIVSGKADKIINLSDSLQIEQIKVSQAVIENVADTKTPQGVVAVARQYQHQPAGLIESRKQSLFLAIDSIQDPGNLGTMIRSADAVGAGGVFVGKGSVDLYNPKVVRATMGSLFHLPVMEVNLDELFPLLKRHDVTIIGTSVDHHEDIYSVDLTGSIAIVIGSEAHGISEEIRRHIDRWMSLPMPGKAESLNAAIASSVVLYEALRQRRM
ncbi:TrmH family RNA methyltransferase [Effusibacillus dendaii]|uniref:RNA methyltransferase n=1 Tax=Effusibacillus dendaii TaxID=2743772 RepID=A0A7I8DFK3_9BACL|nr:RNA methyltransferase [Effusibacillus dendaii]BCJ88092.1 RNA methyltransferase [Effusibacillus dendaii]